MQRWIEISLTVTVSILVLSGALWPQQLDQEIEIRPVRVSERRFQPSRLPDIRLSTPRWEVSLESARKCLECVSHKAFLFRVRDKIREHTGSLLVGNATAQMEAVYLVGESRAVVMGEVTPHTSIFTVVDLVDLQVRDSVLCSRPAPSPKMQYIIYRKVFPEHFTPGVSAQYLVYDLMASAEDNRPELRRTRFSNDVDVGLPIYPPGARNMPADNYGLDESEVHGLSSTGFFWLDDHTAAFMDQHRKQNSFVIVDLSDGPKHAGIEVIPVDTETVVDTVACTEPAFRENLANAFWLDGLSYRPSSPNILKLHFRTNSSRCLRRTTLEIETQYTFEH